MATNDRKAPIRLEQPATFKEKEAELQPEFREAAASL